MAIYEVHFLKNRSNYQIYAYVSISLLFWNFKTFQLNLWLRFSFNDENDNHHVFLKIYYRFVIYDKNFSIYRDSSIFIIYKMYYDDEFYKKNQN